MLEDLSRPHTRGGTGRRYRPDLLPPPVPLPPTPAPIHIYQPALAPPAPQPPRIIQQMARQKSFSFSPSVFLSIYLPLALLFLFLSYTQTADAISLLVCSCPSSLLPSYSSYHSNSPSYNRYPLLSLTLHQGLGASKVHAHTNAKCSYL